jgi:hypothetical protein
MKTSILIFICCAILCTLVLVTLYGLVHNRNVREYWKKKWLEDLEKLDESEDYKKGFRRALEMIDKLY